MKTPHEKAEREEEGREEGDDRGRADEIAVFFLWLIK